MIKDVNIVSAGFPDSFIPAGKRELLLKMYGLDAVSLSLKIQKMLKDNPAWQK